MSKNNYNDASIQVLSGLDPVKKRPGMYIGSTDSRGLHHLLWEIIDNSVDEVLAGFCDTIKITLKKDKSVEVEDNGRGIPTGKNEKTGKSTIETVYTVLHAGGKFDNSSYKVSGGLHGVGASVTNALSQWMEVAVSRDGKKYEISFKNGGAVDKELKVVGTTNRTGTTVRFLPDVKIFKSIEWNFSLISERLRESSFLLKGLKILLRSDELDKEEEFHYDNGIVEYVEFINDKTPTLNKPIYFNGNNSGMEVDIAMQWTDKYSETIISFANNVKTSDGGTHEAGFKSALTKTFNEYARGQGLLKEKDKNFEGSDVREGLTAIISIRVPEKLLQYEGQTKGRLGTQEARAFVENVVEEKLKFWFKENKLVAINVINKAIKAVMARESARKARDAARGLKQLGKRDSALSGKLTPAQLRDPEKIELFLVEGDSAGGSAKLGRDKKFQAILPLKGKVINSEKAKLEDLLKNEEILAIINTIGASVGPNFKLEDCNYKRIIIMTDADVDGAHIQTLLLTFFYRYMRPLIEVGKIFIAAAPLFKVEYQVKGKKEFQYAWDDVELKSIQEEVGKASIQRYKGLGEMNFDQLWDTTMDPNNRKLIKINIEDAALCERRVETLMGNNSEIRRNWINENVKFSLEDNFNNE